MVNLFIILPESESSIQWALSNEQFQDEDGIVIFIKRLKNKLDSISLEEYNGHYDVLNIKNFLRDFEDVAEFYPNPSFRLLRSILKNWNNWREEIEQDNAKEYKIFSQCIEDHIFCEIAERQINFETHKFALLNHYGHELGDLIEITVQQDVISINSLSTEKQISLWFANERVPARNFQVIPKHGENRQDERIINGELISPLRCSGVEAQNMLHFAIGDDIKELYNYDSERGYFIVFKFEGNNPQNMYHGYHVPVDTTEISSIIKDKLREQNNDS